MAADPFGTALAFTLLQEGSWADDPRDSGGPTMRGITLAVFRAWRHDPKAAPDDLREIGNAEVQAIYRALYWNPVAGASLAPGVSLSVFDAAVNLGVRRAAQLLQACVGVAQDGAVGPITLAAVQPAARGLLLARYANAREAFYRGCGGFEAFGRGWLARTQACFAASCQAAGLRGLPPRISLGTPESIAHPGTAPQPSADSLMAAEQERLGGG